jgi:hypothetical protein
MPPIFNERREYVAVSSNQPDSLRWRCRRATKAASAVTTAFPIAQRPLLILRRRNLTSMLPGFRFLFAAIVLSMSILVFGLGATALLRAAHEEFANTPSWQPATETRFAQQNDAATPVLSMLRLDESPAGEQPASDNAAAAPAEQKLSDHVAAPAERASAASMPVESEKIAALKPEQSSQPEIPVSEAPDQAEVAPAQADAPAAADETTIAATEQASPPAKEAAPAGSEEVAPTAPEQAGVPGSPDTAGSISTKIATLDGSPAAMDPKPPVAAAASAKPDKSAIKKREQALRAKRRRIALRARVAAQAAQQSVNPFAASNFGR